MSEIRPGMMTRSDNGEPELPFAGQPGHGRRRSFILPYEPAGADNDASAGLTPSHNV